VVVSQGQNEIAEMAAKGLDIVPHRKRMVEEDLETKFKDPDDPLRLVFVCAMWMTGFDVPSCSTIYLDKPMRNHTLMQTIARANRVWAEKNNGLIVDYVGVFRDLQRALAIYGSGPSGTAEPGETPVEDKAALVEASGEKIAETSAFCAAQGISVDGLIGAELLDYLGQRKDAVELLLVTPDTKTRFLHLADEVDRLFKAILPDTSAAEYGPYRALFVNLAETIRNQTASPADISAVMSDVEALLDESVAAKAYVIRAAEDDEETELIDLSQVDFEALAAKFATGRKYTQAERLKRSVAAKAAALARLNPTRIDYLERFQRLIDEYNAGSRNITSLFEELCTLAQELNEEELRHLAEQLDEEQLALFDILTRPEPELSTKEQAEVKKVAAELLDTLKQERLVLDWRKKQQTRASVKLCIEETLDHLPTAYSAQLYQEKVGRVYEHIYESYWGEGRGIYSEAA
jgi:type I restriction enzyme R subunit